MAISKLKDDVLGGFNNPTALPVSSEQETEWQEANRTWWERHPMRYDFSKELGVEEFSKEFYEEIDRRFFTDAATMITWKKIPFDSLINFSSLKKKDVLEIGCGNGSHAKLLASWAHTYTGIDITQYAVQSTTQRFRYDGLNATIEQMDAEQMSFPSESFDYIWSWGVIHHSANTRRIIEEMHRVLRRKGEAKIMVYHRNFWNYYIYTGFMAGIFKGDLFKTKSIHRVSQKIADGAIARFYTPAEWESLVSDLFRVKDLTILGSKTGLIPLPAGYLKNVVMSLVPNSLSRLLTNRMKLGAFLVSTLEKK